ncbi:hypothetical protein [Neobacillus soli]|uniref:hypothetical protein n=1 Tax=Neobacillus soli TaxID=220688 RepID=UPI001C58609F|nr:hypothetical protein [Neobacillus soli]
MEVDGEEALIIKLKNEVKTLWGSVTTIKILSHFPEPQKENYRRFVEGSVTIPPSKS